MWGILTLFSVGYIIHGLVKEKMEKPAPANRRFDWDAYWADIGNGMTETDRIKKRKRGGYYTTKPKEPDWWELPIDTVVDVERYEYDKRNNPFMADLRRQTGEYRQKRPIGWPLC